MAIRPSSPTDPAVTADPAAPVAVTTGKDGRQARWAEHNRQRRRRILDAAIAVLETSEPGAEFHVQQIAERAGLNRTVVYRHFADRGDLDISIQVAIQADLAARLVPEVSLDGSINDIIGRIVATYVAWVVAHPALHAFADLDSGRGDTAQISTTLAELLQDAIELLGADLSDDERASIEPLAFGLVGAVMSAVRRWITRPRREPSADRLAALLSESVWHLLDGHARRLGLDIDPDLPVQELLQPAAT